MCHDHAHTDEYSWARIGCILNPKMTWLIIFTFYLGVAFVDPQSSLYSQVKQRKPRRPWTRAVFSNLQRKGLEKRFQVQKYLTKGDRHQLASMLGLSDNQVKVWFQNRRMKWRQEEQIGDESPEKSELQSPINASTNSNSDAPVRKE